MEFINLDHLYKAQVEIRTEASDIFVIGIEDYSLRCEVIDLVERSLDKYNIEYRITCLGLRVFINEVDKRDNLIQTIADYLREKRGLSVDLIGYTDPILEDLLNNFVPIPGIDTKFNKYQVTQEQWRAVSKLPRVNIDLDPDPSRFKGDKLPVESITVKEAEEFCNRLTNLDTTKEYTLPTADEWLIALSDEADPTTITANIDKCLGKTSIVGSYKANTNGLYDMYGNVKEICKGKDGYVTMGGSWRSCSRDCRSLYCSNNYKPAILLTSVGFRVVCK